MIFLKKPLFTNVCVSWIGYMDAGLSKGYAYWYGRIFT